MARAGWIPGATLALWAAYFLPAVAVPETVAADSADPQIALIDLRSGGVSALLEGHTAPVQVLAFVEGGRRLISSGNDARVLVCNLAPGAGGSGR